MIVDIVQFCKCSIFFLLALKLYSVDLSYITFASGKSKLMRQNHFKKLHAWRDENLTEQKTS